MGRLLSCALFVLLVVTPPLMASPRDELLRAVPDDYTFCVVLHQLRDQLRQEPTSALQRVLNSPVFAAMKNSTEGQQAQQTLNTLLKEFDLTAEQLRDDILGEAVVVAYRKGPADHPEQEDGLIMLQARDAQLLAKLIERLNNAQTRSGEIKNVETVETKDGSYVRRTKSDDSYDAYVLVENQFIFGTREASLKDALARRTASLAKKQRPALAQQLATAKLDDALVVALINPRSFDSDLQMVAATGKPAEQLFIKEFRQYWKAVDRLALFARVKPELEFGLHLGVRTGDLPRAAKTFFAEAGKQSPLWKTVPDDALFAAVGRFHLESFTHLFGLFLATEDRQKIKAMISDAARAFWDGDDFSGIVRGFGPDVGLCIYPPQASDRTWFPNIFVALKTADNTEGKTAEEAALAGLDFVARSACLADKGLRLHKEVRDGLTIKSLSHATKFPTGFRPSVAAKNGYIVVANSPATIIRFDPPRTPATEADDVLFARFSASAWRRYLQTHRDELTTYLATLNGKDAKTMSRDLDGLNAILEGFDRLELRQRSDRDQTTLILRLSAARK